MSVNRIAKVQISEELLREILHFPNDVSFIQAHISTGRYGFMELIIECPSFPQLLPGEWIPVIRPTYKNYYGDNGEIIRVEKTDWGFGYTNNYAR
jgi:hypothetical protein